MAKYAAPGVAQEALAPGEELSPRGAYASPVRNGLVRRSWPKLEPGP